jgi:hypothetical protein
VEWSPDSQWLAVYNRFGDSHQFLVMNAEGTDLQPLGTDSVHQSSWGWSPDSDVYYLDADLRVVRHSPVQNADRLVCDPRDLPGFLEELTPESGKLTVSPDGRFITVSVLAREDRSARGYRPDEEGDRDQVISFVLRSDGSGPQLIHQYLLGASRSISVPGFLWSPDGRHLYFLEPRSRDRVLHWSADSAAVTPVRLPVALGRGYIRPLPKSSGLLLWESGQFWRLSNQGQIERLGPDLIRTLRSSRIVDATDRTLIVEWANDQERDFLAAVDFETGEVTRIYP